MTPLPLNQPIHDREQYHLDYAASYHEISASAHAALMLLADADVLASMMRDYGDLDCGDHVARGWMQTRGAVLRDCERYATDLILTLEPAWQRAFSALALSGSACCVDRLQQHLSGYAFTDATVGGANHPHIPPHLRTTVSNGDPAPRTHRRLTSRRGIRTIVRGDYETIGHARAIHAQLRRLPLPGGLDEASAIAGALEQCRHVAVERATAYAVALRERVEQRRVAAQRLLARVPARAVHRVVRHLRRVIARSALLTDRVMGDGTASRFARGECVIIEGAAHEDLALHVTRARVIGASGHGALHVRLATSVGEPLCSLCVYLEVPALDQLVALYLHARAEGISELLRVANPYLFTPLGATHPLLRVDQRVERSTDDDVVHACAVARYQAATATTWTDAIHAHLWGSRSTAVRRLQNAGNGTWSEPDLSAYERAWENCPERPRAAA